MNIRLEDKIPGCENFYWKEVLWLDGIGACVFPPQEVAENLIHICQQLEHIRSMFGKPIRITSGYRPDKYNKAIGGSKRSQHIKGKALDFRIKDYSCDDARRKIIPYLKELDIRMENLLKSNWIHIDSKKVIPGMSRFFHP